MLFGVKDHEENDGTIPRFEHFAGEVECQIGGGLSASEHTDLLAYSVIRDQIGQSCVGQAFSMAQTIRDRANGVGVLYSGMALYYLARRVEIEQFLGGNPAPPDYRMPDDGTFLRCAAEAIKRWGVVKSGLVASGFWCDTPAALVQPPSFAAMRTARQIAGLRYVRIEGDMQERAEQIKIAIRARYPVVASINCDQAVLDNRGALIGPVSSGVLGKHAICVAGYTGDEFLFVNSWGRDWGTNGIGRANAEALGQDLWALLEQ